MSVILFYQVYKNDSEYVIDTESGELLPRNSNIDEEYGNLNICMTTKRKVMINIGDLCVTKFGRFGIKTDRHHIFVDNSKIGVAVVSIDNEEICEIHGGSFLNDFKSRVKLIVAYKFDNYYILITKTLADTVKIVVCLDMDNNIKFVDIKDAVSVDKYNYRYNRSDSFIDENLMARFKLCLLPL